MEEIPGWNTPTGQSDESLDCSFYCKEFLPEYLFRRPRHIIKTGTFIITYILVDEIVIRTDEFCLA